MAPSSPTGLQTPGYSLASRTFLILQLLQLPALSSAYSWVFREPPSQCGDVTIDVTGTDGTPPYRLLVVPFAANPLTGPNVREVRKVLDIPFEGDSDSVTFQLRYPADSQLVAVVSDANGFGTGGTSVPARVSSSNDSSCFDPTVQVQADFYFNIVPINQIIQCGDTRIWWDPEVVEGDTQFQGVIPGGESFEIPVGELTEVPEQGTGFTWKANVRTSTAFLMVGGDGRGAGNAGSILYFVSDGLHPDSSCIDENSPSSTAGVPAGGSYATGTSGVDPSSVPSNSGGGNNIGAIVGGVVGGLVLLASLVMVIFFYRRRQKGKRRQQQLDLLQEEDEEDVGAGEIRQSRNDLPQFYRPEPFTVPDPTLSSNFGGSEEGSGARPLSGTTTSFYTRSGTPDGSAAIGYGAGLGPKPVPSSTGTGRKGGAPRPMRPVNIIQHDDAGPSVAPPKEDEGPETIELPPAYTAIKSELNTPNTTP